MRGGGGGTGSIPVEGIDYCKKYSFLIFFKYAEAVPASITIGARLAQNKLGGSGLKANSFAFNGRLQMIYI